MQQTESDIAKRPKIKRRTKIIMLIVEALLIATFVILAIIPPIIPDSIFAILLIAIFIDILLIVLFIIPYYNMGITFILIIVFAIFFRRMRWPGTGILFSFGFLGLTCISIYLARVFLKKCKNNIFLKYIGFSSCTILTIISLGLLWKNMHWPLAGIILNTGLILFIPFLFAFVFTLPNANYLKWTSGEKTLFFRAILIPMVFVYILCVLMFVLPDLWLEITRQPLQPFNMFDFELLNRPGII